MISSVCSAVRSTLTFSTTLKMLFHVMLIFLSLSIFGDTEAAVLFDLKRFYRSSFPPNFFRIGKEFCEKLSLVPPSPPNHNLNHGSSEHGHQKQFIFPLLIGRNSSKSLNPWDEDSIKYNDFSSMRKQPTSFQELWMNKTRNSKGLLVFLMPAIFNQLSLLHSISVFLFDRLVQYLQPLVVLMACTLSVPRGVALVQKALYTSISLGALLMFKDTISAGPYWAPLIRTSNDSYAIVTGASSGIGKMLAEMLFEDGYATTTLHPLAATSLLIFAIFIRYNLVLVSRNEESLRALKAKLLERAAEKARARASASNNDRASPAAAVQSETAIVTATSARRIPPPAADVTARHSIVALSSGYPFDDEPKFDSEDEEAVPMYTPSPTRRNSQDVILLPCDLRDAWTPNYVLNELKKRGIANQVDVLVCNAGAGSSGGFLESDLEENCDIVDLNVNSVVSLTRLLVPFMTRTGNGQSSNRGGSRVLVVGSVAGLAPGPNSAVYSATKAFLGSFTLALRREVISKGVIVSLAMPGPVRSKFAAVAGAEKSAIFNSPFLSMSSYNAAKQIYLGMVQGRDVIVPGVLNKLYSFLLVRCLPTNVVADIVKLAWQPLPSISVINLLPSLKERISQSRKRLSSKSITPAPFTNSSKDSQIQIEIYDPTNRIIE